MSKKNLFWKSEPLKMRPLHCLEMPETTVQQNSIKFSFTALPFGGGEEEE